MNPIERLAAVFFFIFLEDLEIRIEDRTITPMTVKSFSGVVLHRATFKYKQQKQTGFGAAGESRPSLCQTHGRWIRFCG